MNMKKRCAPGITIALEGPNTLPDRDATPRKLYKLGVYTYKL